MWHREAGFTLIELMVAVTVLVLAVTVAIPNFQSLVESNRVTTKTNTLLSSFKVARGEAVKLGQPVTLTAVDGDFTKGWCIYEGASGSTCDNAADVVRRFEGSSTGIAIAPDATSIEFDEQGRLTQPGSNFEITVESASGEDENKRRTYVCVHVSGRASTSSKECDS